jgi:membrane dipeptidase
MRPYRRFLTLTALGLGAAMLTSRTGSADDMAERARRLHFSSIVLDTHDDTTQRLFSKTFDLGARHRDGHVDIPRMREGGLGALFFSIWIDGRTTGPTAVQKALDQIAIVKDNVERHAADLQLAGTAADVRRAHEQGKIAVLMGVEGGHMLGDDTRMVRIFAELGVRYLTLTHFYNDEWADSSTDEPEHHGLTDHGEEIVREMNRRGILVDVSHVSDETFRDALAVSRAPMIASHSSCRAICNHPRNMSDEMIEALAAAGGVIQINYEKSFLDQAYKDASEKLDGSIVAQMDELERTCGDDDECKNLRATEMDRQYTREGKLPPVGWEEIVEHIDHVVKLVGPDHVGLGSDFDGATMPDGMDDCSKLPRITEALLRRGYPEDDVRKILGGNTLRVMAEAERVSREMLSGDRAPADR